MGSKSAPNSRSGSFKQKWRLNYLKKDTRRNSFPISAEKVLSCSYNDISDYRKRTPKRVRSFKTTSKGIATAMHGNRQESNASVNSIKDLNRNRLSSETSEDSAICCSSISSCFTGYFRVCIMGADAVGKRTLANQFMCSERMSYNAFDLGEIDDNMLTVVIDNEESTLEFVDYQEHENERFPVDAFIIVFSVHERKTYEVAIRCLQFVRNEQYSDRPIIIVANKVDLVRKRQVSNEEAKKLASMFNCKYIETSATLNLKVDELLVGILKQIKLRLNPDIQEKPQELSSRGPKVFFNKLFHLRPKLKSSCDNVLIL